MKMNAIERSLGVVLLGLFTYTSHGQGLAQLSDAQLSALVQKLQSTPQLEPSVVPRNGNFYSLAHPEWPPLPGDVKNDSVWKIGSDSFLVDDAGVGSTVAATTETTLQPLH
jgi:hypothetical protein